MTIFYSNTRKSFFDDRASIPLPEDAIELTSEEHQTLINGPSQGLVINWNSSGKPTLINPEDSITLNDMKEMQKAFINRERDRVLSEGFEHNSILFDCDEQSERRVTGLVVGIGAGVPLPEDFTFRSKENYNIPMDAQDVIALGIALSVHIQSVLKHSWKLKDYINTLSTKTAIEAVGWDTEI